MNQPSEGGVLLGVPAPEGGSASSQLCWFVASLLSVCQQMILKPMDSGPFWVLEVLEGGCSGFSAHSGDVSEHHSTLKHFFPYVI